MDQPEEPVVAGVLHQRVAHPCVLGQLQPRHGVVLLVDAEEGDTAPEVRAALSNDGSSVMQAGHQEAKKLTTSGLPRKSERCTDSSRPRLFNSTSEIAVVPAAEPCRWR